MDKTAIIIVHYKGEADTMECINSIPKSYLKDPQVFIIVVLNPMIRDFPLVNSNESFAETLKKNYKNIIVVENDQNVGFSAGNNIGIKKALNFGCKYFLLLNNDTIVSPDTLSELVSFGKSDPDIGLVSPKIYFAKGFEYHKNRYRKEEQGRVLWYAGGSLDWANIYASHRGVDEVDCGQFNSVEDTDFATGCAVLIKKSTIERIGLFDEKYFLYYEDIDYSVRAKKNGMRVVYLPHAYIWHKNASSSGKPGSDLHIYFLNRNRLYFGYKYASARAKKSLFLDSLRLFFKGGVYKKSMTDYYLNRMGGVKL